MRCAIFLGLLLAAPALAGEPVYSWRLRADDPDRVYLYRDDQQVGGWCYRAKQYRPYDGTTWGPPSAASPVQPPTWSTPAPMMSWQNLPRRRGLRGRIDAVLDEAIHNYMNSPGFLAGLKFDLKLDGLFDSLTKDLYLGDVYYSAKLFAHFEMGGKLPDKTDSDDYRFAKDLMTTGCVRLFLSEKAAFAKKLKEEKFANPVLAKISFEVEDNNPTAAILIELDPEKVNQSRLLFNATYWRAELKTVASDTPAILMSIHRKDKDAKDNNPFTVHCSFVFTAQKEGRAFEKTLSFDLYLETLEVPKGAGYLYPWKVRNVAYK